MCIWTTVAFLSYLMMRLYWLQSTYESSVSCWRPPVEQAPLSFQSEREIVSLHITTSPHTVAELHTLIYIDKTTTGDTDDAFTGLHSRTDTTHPTTFQRFHGDRNHMKQAQGSFHGVTVTYRVLQNKFSLYFIHHSIT